MRVLKAGAGITLIDLERGAVVTIPKPTQTLNPVQFTFTLPLGQWWKVMSISFGLNMAGGAGTEQLIVTCSNGTQVIWAAAQLAAIPTAALNADVCFGLGHAHVNSGVGTAIIAPLPDVWSPPGAVVTVSDDIAVDSGNVVLPTLTALGAPPPLNE